MQRDLFTQPFRIIIERQGAASPRVTAHKDAVSIIPHVCVVGAGPAGLMAAETIAQAGLAVTVLERMPSVGRKLLMAGRGGLHLTHAEDLRRVLGRFGPARDRLAAAIQAFPPATLMAWCEGLGQPVFTGSSQRVFPTSLKASPL